MKKLYARPEIEITAFDTEDIITLSGDGGMEMYDNFNLESEPDTIDAGGSTTSTTSTTGTGDPSTSSDPSTSGEPSTSA